ncbi:MAG: choline ABC transporter permease subunit [Paracoccus sp. (in: a-proteobacteria)]|uniref:choline ABC transporter permease subunit n=1 Tax=Paracoccus sp. TaxID=267 RepID=UPI0026DEF330|nr:choline ABC transporter permease subunit [Paracoccus sp. (in: a-proteobacteria)]MDO5620788.1 choline ABC transporter permease subunit [Paracoccus sp. (in: a-proteobacteria)]
MDWLTGKKIPVGTWANGLIDWLAAHGAPVFDAIATGITALTGAILWLLMAPHPLVLILLVVLAVWFAQRRWTVCLIVAAGLLFILNQGYWDATMQTLTLVLAACLICMGLGVPIGIACAHRPRLYAWVRPVLDLMQTMPTFVYLIPAIVFFGLGMVAGLIATIVFALPAPIRLTHLGITQTPPALTEAARAFGASPRQLLWKVELPSALPQIMAGLTQTIMLSLSMVVIAAMVAAPGLGVPILRAINTLNTALGVEAGLVIAILAIVLDRALRIERRK